MRIPSLFLYLLATPLLAIIDHHCQQITKSEPFLGDVHPTVHGSKSSSYMKNCTASLENIFLSIQTIMHCINPCIELSAENRFRLDGKQICHMNEQSHVSLYRASSLHVSHGIIRLASRNSIFHLSKLEGTQDTAMNHLVSAS